MALWICTYNVALGRSAISITILHLLRPLRVAVRRSAAPRPTPGSVIFGGALLLLLLFFSAFLFWISA